VVGTINPQPAAFTLPHLSASSISDWLRCPALWYARRVLRTEEPPSLDLAIGSALHAAAEAHHKGEDAELALIKAWAEVRTANPPHAALVRALTALGVYRAARPLADGEQPERFFRVALPGVPVPLIGFFDLDCLREVRDLKTTRAKWWTQQRVDESLQGTAYWYARGALKRPIKRVIFDVLRIVEPIEITMLETTRSAQQVAEFLDTARRVYGEIQDAVTAGRAEPKCPESRCRYWEVCRAWRLDHGSRGGADTRVLAHPERPAAARVEAGRPGPFED
jgi:CRISPR/Cas system-associated exonuclease Cas4 (RecB family)